MCGFEARLRVLGCTKVCGVDVWPGILCYREFAEHLRKVRSRDSREMYLKDLLEEYGKRV